MHNTQHYTILEQEDNLAFSTEDLKTIIMAHESSLLTNCVDRFPKWKQSERVIEDPASVEERRREAEDLLKRFLERTQIRPLRVVGLNEEIVLSETEDGH